MPDASTVQQIIDILKSAAGAGWQVTVSFQQTIGVQEAVGAAIMFLFAAVALPVGLTQLIQSLFLPYTEGDYHTVWSNKKVGKFTIGLSLSFIGLPLLIASVVMGIDAAGHLLNPAGEALQSLIGR